MKCQNCHKQLTPEYLGEENKRTGLCSQCISDKELYALKEKEDITKEPFFKYLEEGYKERFSFKVLENRDFWFNLGYGRDNKLQLGGNCYTWSNAFSFRGISLNLAYKIINLHNKISKREFIRIIAELRGNINKLFFCKEDYRFMDKTQQEEKGKKLTWHFYPTEECNISKEILYTNSIKDFEILNEFERNIDIATDKGNCLTFYFDEVAK